jgi:C1A family cysteine protease
MAGHEMIIIGYDDNAIAVDQDGNSHQGLLFLRNSMGDDVGDNGNNYMSYDFFEKFVDEVQVIYKPDYSSMIPNESLIPVL